MKEYEQFLKEALKKYDPNCPDKKIWAELKGNNRMIVNKLEEEGLIRGLAYVGPLAVMFSFTYEGLHYFDEEDSLKYSAVTIKKAPKKYDVFLSYASKDSKKYIEGLYKELKKYGLNIFYDKESIDWGDEWKKRILESTQDSEFAILVISKNYFGGEWTERELNEFLSRKNESGQSIILPIIRGITNKELTEKYPEIGNIQTISTKNNTVEKIAIRFAKKYIERLKNL